MMTIMEKVKKTNFTQWFFNITVPIACGGALYWMFLFIQKDRRERAVALEQRKNIICPSLLSIGRSSRDTLIIMKNESLCNSFVLDNLK